MNLRSFQAPLKTKIKSKEFIGFIEAV